jgi:hypothetical protein
MNLATGIDSSIYKEIGMRKYWVNNKIWNLLATKTDIFVYYKFQFNSFYKKIQN